MISNLFIIFIIADIYIIVCMCSCLLVWFEWQPKIKKNSVIYVPKWRRFLFLTDSNAEIPDSPAPNRRVPNFRNWHVHGEQKIGTDQKIVHIHACCILSHENKCWSTYKFDKFGCKLLQLQTEFIGELNKLSEKTTWFHYSGLWWRMYGLSRRYSASYVCEPE